MIGLTVMTHPTEIHKLAELRAKTDRQLLEFMAAQLDRALALAEAGESLMHAEKIHAEVQRLLPLVKNANHAEWRRLVARMNELREILDAYSVLHSVA
jgi:hypothetical protein